MLPVHRSMGLLLGLCLVLVSLCQGAVPEQGQESRWTAPAEAGGAGASLRAWSGSGAAHPPAVLQADASPQSSEAILKLLGVSQEGMFPKTLVRRTHRAFP